MCRKNIFYFLFFFTVSFFSYVAVFAEDITVFLVEDEQIARKLIFKNLSEQEKLDVNFQVVKLPDQDLAGSPNGQGAIDWYEANYESLKNKPLLFLMDFHLQENLTGLDTMLAINKIHSGLDPKEYSKPIFVGISGQEENNQALELNGAEGSILKHEFSSSFAKVIQSSLAKRGIFLSIKKSKKRKKTSSLLPPQDIDPNSEKRRRPEKLP